MKHMLAKALIGVAFFACSYSARAEESGEQPLAKVECQIADPIWPRPCIEYAQLAVKYFNAAEKAGPGGIGSASHSAFGHFALDMFRECRRHGSTTTYAFPNDGRE